MREIPLSQGKVALVDDEDFERVSQYRWHAHKNRNDRTYYAVGTLPGGKKIKLHRLILNAPEGLKVDHRDGDGLNNRRSNIRLATHSQNMHNIGKRATPSTSEYKGVHWCKRDKRWIAAIRQAGKTVKVGRYKSEMEAVFAYDRKVRELLGEFARPNLHPDYEGMYVDFITDTL